MSTFEKASRTDDLDLHPGLDRELDLAAERPSTSGHEAPRGPGLMVAAIVASSLSLAGVITLVRSAGQGASDSSGPDPATAAQPPDRAPEVVAEAEAEPVVPSVAPPEPRSPASPPPLTVAVKPAPKPQATRPLDEIAPAAIAPTRRRTPQRPSERSVRGRATEEPSMPRTYRLPPPDFDPPAADSEQAGPESSADSGPGPATGSGSESTPARVVGLVEASRVSDPPGPAEPESAPALGSGSEPPLPGKGTLVSPAPPQPAPPSPVESEASAPPTPDATITPSPTDGPAPEGSAAETSDSIP